MLVLCHGNLCRSPFAALLLAEKAPDLEVRSAGLAATHGDEADPTARQVARRWDLSLEAHRTRPAGPEDVSWADLILGMEGRHAAEVARRWPDAAHKTRLLGDFLEAPPFAIADPWGKPEDDFVQTFAKLESCIDRLAARIGSRAS